ncbi:MAG: T9SS type A sorting domain-containing protein [Flavobacteriales bacterium]|nr:T9SS type A sorting domain-containing protein [Flavobacteriales bacterium]
MIPTPPAKVLRGLLASMFMIGVVQLQAIIVNIQITAHENCSYADGAAQANVSGGVPPYTYLWSTGATTASVIGLSAGPISVTVTDSQSDEATANHTVTSGGYQIVATSGGSLCPGDPYGGYLLFGGVPNGAVTFSTPYFTGIYMGEPIYSAYYTGPYGYNPIELQFMDANGCAGVLSSGYRLGQPTWTTPVILDIQGACAGGANGSLLAVLQHSPTYARTWHQLTDGAGTLFGPNGTIVGTGGGTYGHFATEANDLVQTWTGLAAGDYWLTQVANFAPFSGWMPGGGCGDSVMVTIPDLGLGCGNVNGTVYMDYNEDCVMGAAGSETRVPGALLEFQPGPYYTTANGNGAYSINLPSGPYSVQQIAADIAQHCPAPPAPVNVTGTQTLNIADTALVTMDVQVMMASGPARPGFELRYTIGTTNLTPAASGATSTVMTFDPAVAFLISTPAPSSVVGNTITWNQASLGAFVERSIQVRFQVPPDVGLIGTVLNSTVTVSTANTDAVPANNAVGHAVTITASFDPNDKQANTSSRYSDELYYIDVDEFIDYTIRFQNTGNDTAFTVIITDTLPTTLDPASIIWGAASHNVMRSLVGQGVLKFIFPNILLPDSNANETASHGFVSFRIRPHLPLLPGTEIINIANIYFDFNPPVITEPSVLTAEFSTGTQRQSLEAIRLLPNPANDQLWISSDGTIYMITIIAADGREVLRRRMRTTSGTIDVSGLRAGSFFLVAILDNGSIAHERFIKQ